MELVEQSTAQQQRGLLANKHWGLFFSEMPLREGILYLANQTIHINVETSQQIDITKTRAIKYIFDKKLNLTNDSISPSPVNTL